jgi:hypothetical protein
MLQAGRASGGLRHRTPLFATYFLSFSDDVESPLL